MHLRRTSRRQWWRTANELDEPPQVLRGCGEQHLVSCAAQASQSKPVQPENALHMRKSHLDLLAFAACLLEGLGVGQRPDPVAHILVDISCDLANDSCRALGLQRADRAVVLVGPVIDDVALINVAGAGQYGATWANINITLLVEDKVCSAEGAVVARRLVPHRNVRGDLAIHQPLKQPDRAINSVASEPLGPKIEAAADALHHRLSDGNFRYAVGPRAFGVEDDPELV